MTAYYSEHDPQKSPMVAKPDCRCVIAHGDVDERSIEDVQPSDVTPYIQAHFFAGVGIWSHALRCAGWPDNRPVWTFSCPCQPFSTAGKGSGFDDARHLWPAIHWLIQQCLPVECFAEQVGSKDGLAWLDLVQSDLEATGYTGGFFNIPAAGFGAPHIRQRLYGHAQRVEHATRNGRAERWTESVRRCVIPGCEPSVMGDTIGAGLEGYGGNGHRVDEPGRIDPQKTGPIAASGCADGVADADGGQQQRIAVVRGDESDRCDAGRSQGVGGVATRGEIDRLEHTACPGPVNGHWSDADWLRCRDDKWRSVEPGTFPLVDGAAGRVVRLHAYGDGIVAPQASEFIKCVMECQP